MNITKRLLAGAASVALVTGLVVAAANPAYSARPEVDVSDNSVYCDSLVGQIKFDPPLLGLGHPGTTTTDTVKLKMTLDGCIDQDAGIFDPDFNALGLSLKAAKGKGELQTIGEGSCEGLSGASSGTSGDIEIKWKGNSKDLNGNKIPKMVSDDISGKAISTVSVGQTFGSTYIPEGYNTGPDGIDDGGGNDDITVAWDAAHSGYGMFQIGSDAAHGSVTAPSVAGAYTGGTGGANGYFDGTTGESQAALGSACFAKGIKKIYFGNGQIFFG